MPLCLITQKGILKHQRCFQAVLTTSLYVFALVIRSERCFSQGPDSSITSSLRT